MFFIVYYISPQIKFIRLLNRITAIITLYALQTKLRVTPVALVMWRSCRARRDMSSVLHSTCDTARTTVSYTKMHGLDSVSWGVVTCRDVRYKWNLGFAHAFSWRGHKYSEQALSKLGCLAIFYVVFHVRCVFVSEKFNILCREYCDYKLLITFYTFYNGRCCCQVAAIRV